LQSFSTDRPTQEKDASSHTIAAHRDTAGMVLVFAADMHKMRELQGDHLDAPPITDFLDHLRQDLGNRTLAQNARLIRIRGMLRY
jgi:hypothetical protein